MSRTGHLRMFHAVNVASPIPSTSPADRATAPVRAMEKAITEIVSTAPIVSAICSGRSFQ